MEIRRPQMTQSLKDAYRTIMPRDELDETLKRIEALSDYDFRQLVEEFAHMQFDAQYTPGDYAMLQKKLLSNGIIDGQAVEDEYAKIMDVKEAADYWRDINNSHPSDIVKLSWQEDEKLCEFWKQNEQDDSLIPSDLFFAGNIPILDIEIEVDETDYPVMMGFGQKTLYRVTIFDDYKERILEAAEGCTAVVGAISRDATYAWNIIPICVAKGVDVIPVYEKIGYLPKQEPIYAERRQTLRNVGGIIYAFLSTWYGIQISLLHPTIKDIFQQPVKEKVNSSTAHIVESGKRRAKYIKRHVITLEEIERCIDKPKGQTRQTKTFAWYVIGHWRHYKNGKTVFVKGYWKGILRQARMNFDQGRERIIAN